MKAAVAISYFHRKIGPMVFYTYPENGLKEEEKARLADVMDQSYEESFFTHKFGELASINYYFEIESKIARGNKEMLMISFILESNPSPNIEKLLVEYCTAFANTLKMNKEIYKAFYKADDDQVKQEDFQNIKKYGENLQFWVRELYWMGIEELRERTEEEKWASIMAKPEIFKVIKKLSKGPLALDDLKKWFETVFLNIDIVNILNELEIEKFIFINTIGLDTYVLLVKDVSIMRVPPNCVIDLEEEALEKADLIEIYINEVRDFFEYYTPTPLDSLELFKLIATPKIYNVISQLREGPLPREKILSMVSESSSINLLETLDLLEENCIIQALSYSGVLLYMLNTDIILEASFPKYLKRLLPKESKGYIARSYSHSSFKDEEEQQLDVIVTEEIQENDYQKIFLSTIKEIQSEPLKIEENTDYGEDQEYMNFLDESSQIKTHIADLQKDLLKKIVIESKKKN